MTRTAEKDHAAIYVLRDPSGLLHFPAPKNAGRTVCDTDADLVATLHPVDRAAVWCTACMRNAL
jgi:hypothetical protein